MPSAGPRPAIFLLIIDLIAADQLGAARDGVETAEDLTAYQAAFDAIDRDPAHLLIVAQSGPDIVATMQLSFLPGLARRGALRAHIECGPGDMRPTAAVALRCHVHLGH